MDSKVKSKASSKIRRKIDKERRRCDIIEAAKRIFFSRGYTGTTMDDIAEAAGLTKPTLYSYFKTKDELYYSLTLPIIEKLTENQKRIKEKLENGHYCCGSEIIRDHFNGYFELYAASPEAFRLFMLFQQTGMFHRLKKSIAEKINKQVKERYEAIRSIYSDAMKKNLIRTVNVYHLIDTLWGTFQGIVLSTEMKFGNDAAASEKALKVLKDTLDFARTIISESIENKN
ncbi:MAG: TetR/AcrR family transcriptional regulator [Spirochaetes bacterium]|nr:TetR/AcrR family transcriptional regulator [Spirochaetota bacterium]